MSALGSLVVSLNANIARFESQMNRANYIANRNMREIAASTKGLQTSIDALPASLMRFVTAGAAIAGVAFVFKKAISAADEFRVTTIGIAAGLTNIAKPGQGSFENIFKRNMAYAEEMAKKLEIVAAKTPAEPAEMMMAYNQLVQQGYAARLDEADALGVIVTKIKLATAGQDANKQINQEIRALMQGQAVAGSMLAQELNTRLGPSWAQIVNKHREAGTLLKYLAGLWPGVAVAGEAFEKTLTAQGTTLQGHLKYLGREGLGGLYDDLVQTAASLNEFLRKHEELIAGGIARGWTVVKDIAGGVYTVFSTILGLIVQMVEETAKFAKFWSGLGASGPWQTMARWLAGGADVAGGFGMEVPGDARTQGMGQFVGPPEPKIPKGAKPPEISIPKPPDTGGGGKGGGNLDAVQKRMEDFIDNMRSVASKANGETFSVIDSWYSKEARTLKELEAKIGENLEARIALQEAYEAKRGKLIDDWAAKEQKTFLENAKKMEDNWLASIGLQKELFDNLAQTSPVLGDQLIFKQKALDLEIQIGQATFEKKLQELEVAHIIEKSQADEMRGLKALENQARKTVLNREKWKIEGMGGGLKIGAEDMKQQADTWAADQTAALMKSMPQQISTSMASFFVGALQGRQSDFQAMGWSMAESMIQKLLEGIMVQIIPSLAEGVAGIFGNSGGGGGGGFGGIIGSVIGGITSIFGLKDGGILPGSFNQLPGFASGAIVSRPTLGWIGEGGGSEAVIPLRGGRVPVDMQGGGGQTIIHHSKQEITINGLPTRQEVFKLTRKFRAANDHQDRRRG